MKPADAKRLVRLSLLNPRMWAPGAVIHGPCPIDDCEPETLWRPLGKAFPDLERRDDIVLAGRSRVDGALWVAATGHLVGTFAAPWLRIPPTGRAAFLRFGEFHRMGEGRIAESYLILDIPELMRQAGASPLPRPDAVELLAPPPATQDGLADVVDPSEAERSVDLVDAMIGGLRRYDRQHLGSMEHERFWHPDMMWYGPGGIGTTRGITGFKQHYQRHFLHAFPDRGTLGGGGHKARLGEGAYAASTGWPSVTATWTGDWFGVPAPNRQVGMRVMDFWRREGDLLRENWVLIDLPDLFRQIGRDMFAGLPA